VDKAKLTADRFLEEAYGSRLIPILTRREVDRLTLLIDRAVEIAPLPLHFDRICCKKYFGHIP
jgi:hypothetical protein